MKIKKRTRREYLKLQKDEMDHVHIKETEEDYFCSRDECQHMIFPKTFKMIR